MAIDMNRLPEEGMNTSSLYAPLFGPAYYYFPGDSMWCFTTNRLMITLQPFIFESCDNTINYELGLGVIDSDFCQHLGCVGGIGYDGRTNLNLVYSRKNSVECGTLAIHYPPLQNSNGLLTNKSFTLYPNPTNNLVTISTATANSPYKVVIINAMGQTVKPYQTFTNQASIDVSDLPDGVYNFCIVTETGPTVNEKVVIIH